MNRKGYNLQTIQLILGHAKTDMTLVYIDPWQARIDAAFKQTCRGLTLPSATFS